jgi:hypothetical protein
MGWMRFYSKTIKPLSGVKEKLKVAAVESKNLKTLDAWD